MLERGGLGLIKGRRRADLYEIYMTVSINWGVLFLCVLILRALLFWSLY